MFDSVKQFFAAFAAVIFAPVTVLVWLAENVKVLLALSVLVNLTLVPILLYVVMTDSVKVLGIWFGSFVGGFTETCPRIDDLSSLLEWLHSISALMWVRLVDFRAADVWYGLCFCYWWRHRKPVLYLPEKMVPGNPLIRTVEVPKFQASLMEYIDGKWCEVGQCFRVGTVLLTAVHVVDGKAERLRIQSARGMLEIESHRFRPVDDEADLAYVLLDEREFTRLGLAKAKLVAAGGDGRAASYVTVQTSTEKSTGAVQVASDLFGYVRYLGSTKPGFSGAPYYLGNNVYGMHLGAAVDNLGYDGSYLACKIKRFFEDSTEYFERLARQHQRRGKRLIVRRTHDPCIVEVCVNGQYIHMDRAAVEAVYESAGLEPEYAPESGNATRPCASAQGRGLTNGTPSVVQNPSRPSSTSTESCKGSSKMMVNMASQVSMRARPRSRSPITSTSDNDETEKSPTVKCSKDVLTTLSKLSATGVSTLSSKEQKLLRQYVRSSLLPLLDTASSQDSEQPTEKS